jgi:hypothetical protein
MKELFITLAKLMTKDQCIERLQISIDKYKEAQLLGVDLNHANQEMMMACQLLTLNDIKAGAEELIKDMDLAEKSRNFFKTTTN